MIWSEINEPARFEREVFPFLMRDEAMNCLFIGIATTLVARPERFPNFHLLKLEEAGVLTGAAWMTPPYALGFTKLSDPGVDALVDHVARWTDVPSGIIGPLATAERFLARAGRLTKSTMRQCIHRVDRLIPPVPRSGKLRVVTASDLEWLTEWNTSFCVDCKLPGDLPDVRREAEACVKYGNRFFWEVDGRPVSMAGFHGDTPSGIRISWVYTPPAERGKGYGAAVVAGLTARLLETKRCCFLFTDLDNPISNRLYHNLGYRRVGDFFHCTFAT